MPTKPAKKKSAPPQPKRPQVITVALPPPLIGEIDAIAAVEQRTRTKQINVFLERAVRDYRTMAGRAA